VQDSIPDRPEAITPAWRTGADLETVEAFREAL
jgi:hypothetical protein